MYKIFYTPRFERQYKKLSTEIKLKFHKKEKILRENPFHTELRTHKLSGSLSKFWAASISHKYRIAFVFEGDKIIVLISIGDHDIYESIL